MDELLEFKKSAMLGKIGGQPLCEDYKAALRKCGSDKESLVRLSLKQQCIPYFSHACYENMGMTKDYIKDVFGDYINGYTLKDCDGVEGYTYGLYVDWDFDNDLNIVNDVSSVMWTIGASLVVPASKCPTIYISNRSNVHLVCDGCNSVNIKLFDESKLTIEDVDNTCDITIYKYSDKAEVEKGKYCFVEPKIFDKELRL
jgi:hypothetical protein